jgi:hypothetical protein
LDEEDKLSKNFELSTKDVVKISFTAHDDEKKDNIQLTQASILLTSSAGKETVVSIPFKAVNGKYDFKMVKSGCS